MLARFVTTALAAACTAVILCATATAHGVGSSELRLRIDGTAITGEWSIHLADARAAVKLDPGLTGEPGWRDLRNHEADLRAYLGRQLTLTLDGAPCAIALTPAPIEWEDEQQNVTAHLAATAAAEPTQLGMRCDLLFDLDPDHRAYFSIEDARVVNVGRFRDDLRSIAIDVRQFHAAPVAIEFIREGLWHIWTGFDHMLFLLALLLPAALVRAQGAWSPRPGLWPTTIDVLKVVTAFTLGHSLTLCLAFFGAIALPSRWVEATIALSVFAAAWNNLRPFLPGRAWVLAATFGLVHGLGFAGALSNLSIPRHARVLPLAAFNVGVELGQIAIVIVVLPLLYVASRRAWYPRAVMGAGSFVIAWLAVVWVLERSFSLSLFAHG